MTLDLSTVAPIAGESAMRIRDILRRSHGAFREDWLSRKFRYNECQAHEIAKAMESAGYVRRQWGGKQRNTGLSPSYSATDLGLELIRASAAKRIKRETATAALAEFMKRVRLVNSNHNYLYSVTLTLQISFTPGSFRMSIQDDGIGLGADAFSAHNRGHFGLVSMRERAESIGGRFNVSSESGQGTLVNISLPGRVAYIAKRRWFSELITLRFR
jgi:hypothetical protein